MSINPNDLNARLRTPVAADGFDEPPAATLHALAKAPVTSLEEALTTKDQQGAIDYFDGLPDKPQDEPATLERLTQLAREMRDLEEQINKATTALAELQSKHQKIEQRLIPEIMERLGMDSFKMSDGSTIEVKNEVKAGITADNKPAAMAWLREHDFDGIIKTKVMSEFGKGEAAQAEEARKKLEDAGFSATVDENVHPSTLKSFVKERLENGDNIPVDVFGIFEFKKAKIKLPRARR